jgi:hypothetical protein
MCCESCPKYERCEQNYDLKDECCSRCPEYNDCVGMNNNSDYTDWKRNKNTDGEDYY